MLANISKVSRIVLLHEQKHIYNDLRYFFITYECATDVFLVNVTGGELEFDFALLFGGLHGAFHPDVDDLGVRGSLGERRRTNHLHLGFPSRPRFCLALGGL